MMKRKRSRKNVYDFWVSLFISFDSLCTVLCCLLLLYPLNFEGAHNQFTPFICDGSSKDGKEWKESLYNYRYNVFGNEGDRDKQNIWHLPPQNQGRKIKINKFIVFCFFFLLYCCFPRPLNSHCHFSHIFLYMLMYIYDLSGLD
jgi:hypothetical protein